MRILPTWRPKESEGCTGEHLVQVADAGAQRDRFMGALLQLVDGVEEVGLLPSDQVLGVLQLVDHLGESVVEVLGAGVVAIACRLPSVLPDGGVGSGQ